MTIPLNELEPRGIYKLWARNLILGVWTGDEWIGIREKFGALFLDDCETPGDDAIPGSARADEKIGVLPDGIEMRCTNDPVCENCGDSVKFILDDPDGKYTVRGSWYHIPFGVRIGGCERARPVARQYQPLFDYLTEIGGTP